MAKTPQEWMHQADYDIETAEAMFDSGRYFYSVFMCHLAVEKALKALYQAHNKQRPPKTHNLVLLAETLPFPFSEQQTDFLFKLSRANVATRYPNEMDTLITEFPERKTREILKQGQEMLQWLKSALTKL